MARVDSRIVSRAVIVGLIAASLGLSACGRKGPLEGPPGLAAVDAETAAAPGTEITKPKKKFFLDPLLN